MTATAPRTQTTSAPVRIQLPRTERPAETPPQPSFWLTLLRALASAAA
jgi:hypothetical protein